MTNNNVGVVKELFFNVKGSDKKNPNEIKVDEKGVYLDKFYAKNQNRSILIASLDSYKIAKRNGIDIELGSLGENILIDINPYSLAVGSKIYIGEVILEITQHCTICKSLAKIDKELPEILRCDRGVFARCIKNGKINKIDNVKF